MEALEVAQVSGTGDLRGLDHPGARPAPRLGAVGGPLVAVELEHAEAERLAQLDDVAQGRVDEDAAELDAAAQARDDPLRLGQRAAAGAAVVEDHAQRPRPELDRQLGVGEVGDAADLHSRGLRLHVLNRSESRVHALAELPLPVLRAAAARRAPGRPVAAAPSLQACSGWVPSSGAARAWR